MDHAAVDVSQGATVFEGAAPALRVAAESDGFRHWMMLYGKVDEFVRAAGDFLRAGMARGDESLVVIQRSKIDPLRRELAADADRVRFEDMENVGRNPARIIPAWQDFVEGSATPGRGLRGIGEPIYADRTPAELIECQLHEALLNVAFEDAGSFTLLCPYDTSSLPAPVIEEAFRSHPAVHVHGSESPSMTYLDDDAQHRLGAALPVHATPSSTLAFSSYVDLTAVRVLVGRAATEFGLDEGRTQALVLVVHETAANSIVHGGGNGVVSCWREKDDLVVEIEDRGRFALTDQPLVGRVRPGSEQERGRGLWLANQLADLVQVRTSDQGTAVRVVMHR